MEHRPPRVTNSNNHHSIDYFQWDCATLNVVKKIKSNYMIKHNRPRLSRSFLIKQAPRSNSVEIHLEDLPQTSKWLELNTESIEDYQLFRIDEAAKVLLLQSLPVIRWRLLRLAGIRFEAVTEKMKKVIEGLEAERSMD